MKRSPWQIQKAVVFALILRELKTRFGGRMIGLLWVLFEPMANIAVMLVWRIIVKDRTAGVGVDIVVFLVVAMIPFFIFRNIWFRMMGAAEGNMALFSYRQVKPGDALAARGIMETVMYTTIFVVFLFFFAWMGYQIFPLRPLEYLAMVGLFIVWGVGPGLMSAVGAMRFPALRTFLSLTAFPLYITSGVLIPIQHFPPLVIQYLMWNPLLHMVELTRWAYLPTYHPLMGVNLMYPLSIGIVLLGLGVALFWVNRRRFLLRR
jgi:capsular polysaccharide transport system permease protein